MRRRPSAPNIATACASDRSATSAASRFSRARISARSAMRACAPRKMPILPRRMRVLRVHGGKPKYFHALIGGNFRIDELQAAVLRVKFKYLDGWTRGAAAQRRVLRSRHSRAAALGATSWRRRMRSPGGRHIFNQYVVRVRAARRAARSFSTERGIGTEIYYPVPLHLQNASPTSATRAGISRSRSARPRETLALPIYPELTAGAARPRGRRASAEFYADAAQLFLKSSGSSWWRDSSL